MNIAGEWADHVAFAIDAESLPGGGLVRSIWGQTVA
jgi:ribosomal-protein-alanine N-acetyltransferase